MFSLLSFWFDGPSCASARSCPWFGFIVSFVSVSSCPRSRIRHVKAFHLTPLPDSPISVICDRPFSAPQVSLESKIPVSSMDTVSLSSALAGVVLFCQSLLPKHTDSVSSALNLAVCPFDGHCSRNIPFIR